MFVVALRSSPQLLPDVELGRKRRWEAGKAAGSTRRSLAGLSATEDFVQSTDI